MKYILNRSSFCIVLFCFFMNNMSLGQVKMEREDKIPVTKVPMQARATFQDLEFPDKPDWYIEKSQDGTTYEAKTDLNKHRWSIEFDSIGQLLDAEVVEDIKDLSLHEQKLISATLDKNYPHYHIDKIQIHWEGKPFEIKEVVHSFPADPAPSRSYEVVFHQNTKEGWKSFEITIGAGGKILKTLIIPRRPMDNIEF